jgi:erythromycin esterase-like protein
VRMAAICAVAMGMAACSEKADVTREELVTVIERDGVAFSGETIPEEVVDRLAMNRVIVLGETHHLREHWAFVAALLRDLHARGFRQLLFEAPHMADWLFDDYVTGGELEPNWEPPKFYLSRLAAIREFNDTLPPGERIHVRAIDVNEEHYGGANGFRSMLTLAAKHLPEARSVATMPRRLISWVQSRSGWATT